ncbi:MAG TPA: BON domain-containing protein [Pirellulales bacterium]|nr:BON domain-containing protein [Pirellulales bacterium]
MRRFIVAWAISTIALVWPVCASADVQDNDLVAHKIHDVLKSSGRMSGSSFVIKCQDGTAWLEGRVSSEEQKALALKLTGEVPEVADVVDHLRVEPKKSRNPVARMLAHQTEEPQPQAQEAEVETAAPSEAEEPAEATAEAQETPVRQTKPSVMSWFSRPSVKAAEAPRPRAHDVASAKPKRSIVSHQEPALDSDAPVYPESLEPAEETPNSLVKQVANLRTIFRRNTQPAPRPQATESAEAEPRVMPRPSSRCVTCNQAGRSAQQRTVQTVSNKTNVAARQATVRNQPTQAGRVRMVPMMEMPDGTLVPVQQIKRAPLGQPIPAQAVASSSRSKAAPSKKGRANVARRQEVIEGPMDAEPAAGPVPVNGGGPLPAYVPGVAAGVAPAYYDQPHMPNYAWPSYAAHPNYAGVTYPRQYSPTAWPYIGPFYPYPQVPLGWRKVTLEWDDGWWFLDFDDTNRSYAY